MCGVNGYAWAALGFGMIAAGFAALRYADRIRITIEVRQFRRDMNRHLAALERLENAIAETRRRMRECTEGGDG